MSRGGKRPGAGRKKGPRTERMEIRLTPENKAWLEAQEGTKTDVVNRLIEKERRLPNAS